MPRALAVVAANQFRECTRKKPTVVVDRDTYKASGPFLDFFISSLFETLEIDASPEVWARAATMEKKRSN